MRRCLKPLIVIFMCWTVLTSCQKRLPPEIVAEIDGDSITAVEFTDEFYSLVDGLPALPTEQDLESLEKLKKSLLDQLIEERLVLHEAKKMGIGVSDEELQGALESIQGGYPAGGLEGAAKVSGVSLSSWKEGLRKRLLIEKVINRVSQVTASIDEATLRRYYKKHQNEFMVSEQVKARQIVVKDINDAQEILKKLKGGESFEALVKRYSTGPEAEAGGDLGFFGREEMPEEFEVVFSLKVGEISDIVQSPYGYHIFQVADKQGASTLSFEEVREHIREIIMGEREEETFHGWLKEIMKRANISINKKVLKEIRPPSPQGTGG